VSGTQFHDEFNDFCVRFVNPRFSSLVAEDVSNDLDCPHVCSVQRVMRRRKSKSRDSVTHARISRNALPLLACAPWPLKSSLAEGRALGQHCTVGQTPDQKRDSCDLPADVEIWARELAEDVAEVIRRYPESDPGDVRRVLIYLQLSPLERLNRSLRRGRGFAAFRR
jgi:hypothetical protein